MTYYENQEESRILNFAHTARVSMHIFILFITVLYQLQFSSFINYEVLFPVYCALILGFLSELVFHVFLKNKTHLLRASLGSLLLLDLTLITYILLATQLQNTLFLFFYLYVIFLSGLVFRAKGSLWFAIVASVFFSLFLSTQIQLTSGNRVLIFGINNIAFFVIAILSGYLSEQLYSLTAEIQSQKINLIALKNINELIISSMQNGLITIDMSGQLIQINPSAQRILGQKPSKISHIKGLSSELQFILESFKKQKDSLKQNIEIEFESKGYKRILDFTISKLFINPNEVSAFVLIFQDISEKKRLEEKLKQKEKLAAVGQLAAGIAHEIRNPLASVSGSIQMLKSYMDQLEPDQIRLMNITLKETDRLNDLITEFLEYVKPEIAVDEPVNLSKLITEVLDVVKLNTQLNSHVSQDVQLTDDLLIQGNYNKLKQVFLNIVINAYHAMDKREKGILKVRAFTEGDEIKITIHDNGVGMGEETKRRIFEPFFSTKPKGTGLGLAIVHKILEAHSADVSLESKENIGTEFIIKFKKLVSKSAIVGENKNSNKNDTEEKKQAKTYGTSSASNKYVRADRGSLNET